MKRLLRIIPLLALTACQSPQLNCITAVAALDAYKAAIDHDGASPEQIATAKSASAFLKTYCGYVFSDTWDSPPATRGRYLEPVTESFDGNGVLIVAPR